MSTVWLFFGVVALIALLGAWLLLFRPASPQPVTRSGAAGPAFAGQVDPTDVVVRPTRRLRSLLMLIVTITVIAAAVGVVLGLVVFAAGLVMNSLTG